MVREVFDHISHECYVNEFSFDMELEDLEY